MWLSFLKGCILRILIFFSSKWNTRKSVGMDLKTVQHSYAEARLPLRQTPEENLSWVRFSKWAWNVHWKSVRNMRLKWTHLHALILPVSVVLGNAIINSKCSVPEILVHFLFLFCMEIFIGVYVKSQVFSLWFYFCPSIFLFVLLYIYLNKFYTSMWLLNLKDMEKN